MHKPIVIAASFLVAAGLSAASIADDAFQGFSTMDEEEMSVIRGGAEGGISSVPVGGLGLDNSFMFNAGQPETECMERCSIIEAGGGPVEVTLTKHTHSKWIDILSTK